MTFFFFSNEWIRLLLERERERELGKIRTAEQKKFKTLFFLFLSLNFITSRCIKIFRECVLRGVFWTLKCVRRSSKQDSFKKDFKEKRWTVCVTLWFCVGIVYCSVYMYVYAIFYCMLCVYVRAYNQYFSLYIYLSSVYMQLTGGVSSKKFQTGFS